MLGRSSEENGTILDEHRGLQQRCIEYLFWRIEQMRNEADNPAEVLVKATFVEIYNEQFVDLVVSY
jgi:Kinesin motor domain